MRHLCPRRAPSSSYFLSLIDGDGFIYVSISVFIFFYRFQQGPLSVVLVIYSVFYLIISPVRPFLSFLFFVFIPPVKLCWYPALTSVSLYPSNFLSFALASHRLLRLNNGGCWCTRQVLRLRSGVNIQKVSFIGSKFLGSLECINKRRSYRNSYT